MANVTEILTATSHTKKKKKAFWQLMKFKTQKLQQVSMCVGSLHFSIQTRILNQSLTPSHCWAAKKGLKKAISNEPHEDRKNENKLKLFFSEGDLINIYSITCQLNFSILLCLPRYLQNSCPVSDPILCLTATTVPVDASKFKANL